MSSKSYPTVFDIQAAEDRLSDQVIQTPILESSQLNEQLGCRLLLKAEALQRTGSFKFRGAYNKISQIPTHQRFKGVVAYSSGNHAQGVAAAAQIFDLPATIVMPSDAPDIKIQNTRSYGADIEFYDRKIGNRVKMAKRISDETGGLLIPPYNDPDIIAGQGTIALELIRQSEELNVKLDIVMGPSSGGGMMSGCSLVLKHYDPRVMLYCVEPENYDDIAQSLACGQRMKLKSKRHSICDALLLETPGDLTFQILKELNVGGLVVSDQATVHAMLVAFQAFKIVLEPSGAIALAAALEQKINLKGKTVAVICTGGNVDPSLFQKALMVK